MAKTLLISAVVLLGMVNYAIALVDPTVYEGPTGAIPETQIDRLVRARLARTGINPSVCSDGVFIRRAFLDVIGTLPTAKEAKEFIQDPDIRNKRRLLIDRLLERDEYAVYWALKWGDILRIKAEFPVNLWPNAAQAYHRWVMASLKENKPYDKFVREMLTSNGSNFRVGPVNFYRAIQQRTPEGIASAVALTFMGTRSDFWPKHYLPGMAPFFSQISYKPSREWKEEIVFFDPDKPAPKATNTVAQGTIAPPVSNEPQMATFPDGTQIQLPPGRDPREVFAEWLITPRNPWFTVNIVNRQWSWLLGRGIIHEPDDIRSNNPPSNPELLKYLETEMIASKYNMKHIFRLILNSRTYQASSVARVYSPAAEANFAYYPLRRLDAEVLIDALNFISGATDLYTSPIPEPFTFIPDDKPAIAIADGSITSPFLEMFGRPARATGMENERVNKPLPPQRLHILNSSHVQRKLEEGPKLKAIYESSSKSREVIEQLYLAILSRFPSAEELRTAEAHARSKAVKGREGYIDVAWALVNTMEFLYRH
ncbi:MAG: DUF1553 domain-containing protein [Verrucomicrobia bacterium]|nr:DUF1553 domain-containing protein [Verrucomicrobiota bacterium]